MQPAQLEVTAGRNWSQDFNPNCPPLYHFTPGGKDWGQDEKGSDRGGNGWMASLTQRTWVWANSGKSWRTGMPGMLQSMGLRHDWTAKQQHILWECLIFKSKCLREWGCKHMGFRARMTPQGFTVWSQQAPGLWEQHLISLSSEGFSWVLISH